MRLRAEPLLPRRVLRAQANLQARALHSASGLPICSATGRGRPSSAARAAAAQTVRRDVMPGFIAAELIVWLNEHKIIRPGYTTLQELVSEALSAERRRLAGLLSEVLDESAKAALGRLLVRDDTLSQLAALKRDAKDFGWRQMAREREKRATLEPLHRIASAAAQARRLAAESAVLRQPGELLHRPRSTQPEGRSDLPLPALLCLGALPAAFRQPGRCDGLPHEAVGGRKQCGRKAIRLSPSRCAVSKTHPGRPPAVALHRRQRARSPPFGDVRQRACKIMPAIRCKPPRSA